MRRQLVMALAAAALVVPSAAAFADHEDGHQNENGNACPQESGNPEGTPPSCGNGGGQVPDNDGDGIPNNEDNCPATANPGQEDGDGFEDGEGAGDACEEQPPAENPPPVEEPVESGTCAEGGVGGATVANQAAGTQDENGPISSQIHANEGQAPAELQPVVHEVSCLVATVDNNLAQ